MKHIILPMNEKKIKYYNMIERCSSKSFQDSHPWYRGCTVCEEWLEEPELFYEWMDENWYQIDGESIELDKDILKKGNKTYCPEYCCPVPQRINRMFAAESWNKSREKEDGLPVGVNSTKGGKYKPYIRNLDGEMIPTCLYDTVEEAWNSYVEHRKACRIAIADIYRGKIPEKLYWAIINWEEEMTD